MATLTTSFMTQKDTLLTIKFKPTGISGVSWEGKEYGPGGQANGFNGGDTVSMPAFWAARWIGQGKADLLEEGDGPTTPFGAIDNRDPEPRRGRR